MGKVSDRRTEITYKAVSGRTILRNKGKSNATQPYAVDVAVTKLRLLVLPRETGKERPDAG